MPVCPCARADTRDRRVQLERGDGPLGGPAGVRVSGEPQGAGRVRPALARVRRRGHPQGLARRPLPLQSPGYVHVQHASTRHFE